MCFGLKKPHRLIGSDSIRRCGLIRVSMSLGMGFGASGAKARPSGIFLFLLPADPDVELSYLYSTRTAYVPLCFLP